MDAVTTAERMTAQEFLAIPWDGIRAQLVEGEIVVIEPTFRHQRILRDLARALDAWAIAAPGRGTISWPIDVLVDDRNVYGPDLLWYRYGRAPREFDDRPYPVPDLAVEVRSQSTWRYDIGAKKSGYERVGLPELWLVDSAADVVLVFRRSAPGAPRFDIALELAAGEDLNSPQLPGLTLPVGALFGG